MREKERKKEERRKDRGKKKMRKERKKKGKKDERRTCQESQTGCCCFMEELGSDVRRLHYYLSQTICGREKHSLYFTLLLLSSLSLFSFSFSLLSLSFLSLSSSLSFLFSPSKVHTKDQKSCLLLSFSFPLSLHINWAFVLPSCVVFLCVAVTINKRSLARSRGKSCARKENALIPFLLLKKKKEDEKKSVAFWQQLLLPFSFSASA